MTIIDTSAVMAVLLGEQDADRFLEYFAENTGFLIGAPTRFELMIVSTRRRGPQMRVEAERFLGELHVDTVAFDSSQSQLAMDAFLRFGKGRHKASLNFGDCMAYALAKSLDVPLLFKGDDFSHTDISPAISSGSKG